MMTPNRHLMVASMDRLIKYGFRSTCWQAASLHAAQSLEYPFARRGAGVGPGGCGCARLGVKSDELTQWRILRKSLDARSRTGLRFVYSAVVHLPEENRRFAGIALDGTRTDDIQWFAPSRFDEPTSGDVPLVERPIVVGSGPAGLLAGCYLALRGYAPLILERGRPVKESRSRRPRF